MWPKNLAIQLAIRLATLRLRVAPWAIKRLRDWKVGRQLSSSTPPHGPLQLPLANPLMRREMTTTLPASLRNPVDAGDDHLLDTSKWSTREWEAVRTLLGQNSVDAGYDQLLDTSNWCLREWEVMMTLVEQKMLRNQQAARQENEAPNQSM